MKNNFPPLYYSDYLDLNKLLSTQKPKSLEYGGKLAHDEMLFIIVHQAYELWFKQILHELGTVIDVFSDEYIKEKEMGIAVLRLRRVVEIQKLLIEQLRILETMTPLDFLDFRDYLFPASGFQSFQFRLIENRLGLKSTQRKNFEKTSYFSRLSSEHQQLVLQSEKEPTLFDVTKKWLERIPFLDLQGFDFWQTYHQAVEKMLSKDRQIIKNNATLSAEEKKVELAEFAKTETSFAALFDKKQYDKLMKKGFRGLSHQAMQAALLINLYRDEPILHLPFRFITSLVDIDELLSAWRYRHALMVQRMIGSKIGTGGSSGHQYLRVTAESHKIFSDFTNLSTYFIPRSQLPELPEKFRKNLDFYYNRKKG